MADVLAKAKNVLTRPNRTADYVDKPEPTRAAASAPASGKKQPVSRINGLHKDVLACAEKILPPKLRDVHFLFGEMEKVTSIPTSPPCTGCCDQSVPRQLGPVRAHQEERGHELPKVSPVRSATPLSGCSPTRCSARSCRSTRLLTSCGSRRSRARSPVSLSNINC